MRKPIIVGNWKMNKTCAEAQDFVSQVDPYIEGVDSATYGVGAPYTALSTCTANAKNLIVAAENCHFEDNGAFTGEVSIPMLKELNVTHCIIGHSERRQYFAETDETVNKKIKKLLDADITPIMCIGETEAQYDAGQTIDVLKGQLHGGLKDLCEKCVSKIVIAYEPIWAIGTGKSANMEIAENCCKAIREEIRTMLGDFAAVQVKSQILIEER